MQLRGPSLPHPSRFISRLGEKAGPLYRLLKKSDKFLWDKEADDAFEGLKNAGATYQRCIQNCFKEQIGRNVHAYVDDVVIKSQKADSLVADLTETFNNLRKYKMKLNPSKCVFGVPAGKLLGFCRGATPE